MENKMAQKHVELDEYHNHKYVLQELRDSRNILSKNKSKVFIDIPIKYIQKQLQQFQHPLRQ
jgi:hypothetical protein